MDAWQSISSQFVPGSCVWGEVMDAFAAYQRSIADYKKDACVEQNDCFKVADPAFWTSL